MICSGEGPRCWMALYSLSLLRYSVLPSIEDGSGLMSSSCAWLESSPVEELFLLQTQKWWLSRLGTSGVMCLVMVMVASKESDRISDVS